MKYDRLDEQDRYYEYTLNDGTRVMRYQIIAMIKKTIGDDKKTVPQIAKEIGIDRQVIYNLVRYLCAKMVLGSKKMQRHSLYFVHENECLLAKLFYPPEMVQKFTIKSRKIYRG